MAQLTLSDVDIAEVRFLVDSRLSDAELTDTHIESQAVLGSATDYVYEAVIEDMNLDVLTDAERQSAERIRDDSPDDVDTFVSRVLKPPQQTQFKRAVIYRCAGLSLPAVRQLESEAGGGTTQRLEIQTITSKQAGYFTQADDEIKRLRDAFPNDAFPSSTRTLSTYKLFQVSR